MEIGLETTRRWLHGTSYFGQTIDGCVIRDCYLENCTLIACKAEDCKLYGCKIQQSRVVRGEMRYCTYDKQTKLIHTCASGDGHAAKGITTINNDDEKETNEE